MKHLALLISIIALATFPVMADPTITLNPANGIIQGSPGQTVGWGFTISNSVDFLVVDEFDFDAVTSLGTFTDFSADNFIVVGPTPESTSVSQVFDPIALTGIGSFTISGGATVGQSAAGNINLHYDLFSVDPNDPSFDPDVDTIASDQVVHAFAQVNVVAVPEPTGLLPLGAGLLLLVNRLRRRV
jgi:hypothetical protein